MKGRTNYVGKAQHTVKSPLRTSQRTVIQRPYEQRLIEELKCEPGFHFIKTLFRRRKR